MSTKRKSDTSNVASKKARTHTPAQALVTAILANTNAYPISNDESETRNMLVQLAQYTRNLEEEIVSGAGAEPSTPAPKTKDQLEGAAQKIEKAARSGIRKQMTWKPTCKEGRAKWSYDGLCSDPEVFAVLLNLREPMKSKTRKMPKDEFEQCFGDLDVSVRYDTLSITGTDVNIRYDKDSGEFKFSGTYGRSGL